jgi:hypothetical protein
MAGRDYEAVKSRGLSASPLVSLINQRKSFQIDSPRKPYEYSRISPLLQLPSSSDLHLGKSLASNKHGQAGLTIPRVPMTSIGVNSNISYPYPFKKCRLQLHFTQRTLTRKELERLPTKKVKVQGKALCFSMAKNCLASPNQVLHRNTYCRERVSQPFIRRSNSILKHLKGKLEDIFMSHKVASDVKLGVVSTQLKIGPQP